ncbi:TetR family transcriptional regulator C-terminal domain-containing protein [Flavobacterium crassostreae]|uniref:Heat-shock protein n=1 Tax=Flavobacterium crassostreae TaxID=1763534 RepID=A0A1B9E7G8_9FLAO|nr:TetR family transcriptional regulator C-terminal domain-containing protein [Flavobacterium crassostreae]OCB77886.1 heat-shock protein [Flavobacterium crassostreae]
MAPKNSQLSKEKLISLYMEYTLEHNEKPKSVYLFCKQHHFTEADFYAYFGTLESMEKEIYKLFLDKTVALLQQDPNYADYDLKNKMLSFYFTFFELLKANRSYVTQSLNSSKNHLKDWIQLSALRTAFLDYVADIIPDDQRIKQEKLQKIQQKALQESAWIQLLMALKFWLEDASANFEKTDIYIEKSVKLSFELMQVAPIDSLIDFGKFMFKEKIQKK